MYTTYENLKSLISSKALSLQYMELSDRYDLFITESGILYTTTIYKAGATVDGINPTTEATRISDFETNYKAHANQPLEIKAGVGRPMRVSASPQPINTVQKFKGFQLVIPANATSATLDISFPQDIYLKGGTILTATSFAIDDTISLDGIYIAYNIVVVPKIVDGVFLPQSIDQKLDFTSPESMYLATAFSLRVTAHSPSGASVNTARILNILITYYM